MQDVRERGMQEAGVGVAGRATRPRKSSRNQWHSFSKQHIRETQGQGYILFSARKTVPRLREGYRLAAEAVRLLRCNCCSNNLKVLQLRCNITVRRCDNAGHFYLRAPTKIPNAIGRQIYIYTLLSRSPFINYTRN